MGIIGKQSPTALSIDAMCLTHDREFLLTSSQDCLKFWSVGAIPTLPSDGPSGKRKTKAEVADRDDTYSRKKRKKERNEDKSDVDFFADL